MRAKIWVSELEQCRRLACAFKSERRSQGTATGAEREATVRKLLLETTDAARGEAIQVAFFLLADQQPPPLLNLTQHFEDERAQG